MNVKIYFFNLENKNGKNMNVNFLPFIKKSYSLVMEKAWMYKPLKTLVW